MNIKFNPLHLKRFDRRFVRLRTGQPAVPETRGTRQLRQRQEVLRHDPRPPTRHVQDDGSVRHCGASLETL